MLNEAQIKSVALFFFYAFMDERAAFQATVRVIEKCQKRIAKGQIPDEDIPSVIVNYTRAKWEKWQGVHTRSHLSVTYEAGWVLPSGISLGAWQDFRKSADPDELLAVIWSKILSLSDVQIAKGLGVTVGTVRHRVGRGLRQLGQIKHKEIPGGA